MSQPVAISSGELNALIDPFGAELVSLTDTADREYMSDGDPQFWTGRAPLLFPIVGRLRDDCYRLGGNTYAMKQHGFARRSTFELIETRADFASFRLSDSDETRTQYPFSFELDMEFALAGAKMSMAATARNTGDKSMPFSFGYHPAFSWPLPDGGDKLRHTVAFASDEPHDLAGLNPQGFFSGRCDAPVDGRILTLNPDLFENDALVWDNLASRALSYVSPGGPRLDIGFPDTPYLGIWQKPGANFICIEPWAGLADRDGFTGDFDEKNGIMTLASGAERSFRMDVTVRPR